MRPPRQRSIIRVWPVGIHGIAVLEAGCKPVLLRNLVDVIGGRQVDSTIPDITNREDRALPHALLDGCIPLPGIGDQIMRIETTLWIRRS